MAPSIPTTQQCSVCADSLLRQIRQGSLFWYCPSCRQEMTACAPTTVDLSPSVSSPVNAGPSQPEPIPLEALEQLLQIKNIQEKEGPALKIVKE